MSRLIAAFVLALCVAAPAQAQTTPSVETASVAPTITQWRVRSAEGLDAALLVGAAAGDVMQAEEYPEEIAWVRANVSPEGLAALDWLDANVRQEAGILVGPRLVALFSAGPFDTLDDVIAAGAEAETRLGPLWRTSPHWDEEDMPAILEGVRHALVVLRELKRIGFSERWARDWRPLIVAGVARNREVLAPHDVIPQQRRLLGTPLDPEIEIVIVHFSKPYGIRVFGQRFLAHHEYDADTQLRIAAHEIFHPPFAMQDETLWSRLRTLEADPWMASIVVDHDPSFGYNSFDGVVNEDSTQALDQIVSERIGFARDPADRWRRSDGGMHMLAAALYHAMKEDGFDERGGIYSDWLKGALDRGLLTPAEVRRRAAVIVGEEAVARWGATAPPAP